MHYIKSLNEFDRLKLFTFLFHFLNENWYREKVSFQGQFCFHLRTIKNIETGTGNNITDMIFYNNKHRAVPGRLTNRL